MATQEQISSGKKAVVDSYSELSSIRPTIQRAVLLLMILMIEATVVLGMYLFDHFLARTPSSASFTSPERVLLVATVIIAAVIGCILMFSERKELTRPLEEASKLAETTHNSNRLLLASLDVLQEGFVQTDRHGRILHFNRPMEEWTGSDLKTLKGSSVATLFDVTYSGTRKKATQIVDEVVRTGAKVDTGGFAEIHSVGAKPFRASLSAEPVLDERGIAVGVSMAVRPHDIHEKAPAAPSSDSQTSAKPTTAASETAADPFDRRGRLIVDSNARVIECDEGATRLFGCFASRLTGRNAADLITFNDLLDRSNGSEPMSFLDRCESQPYGSLRNVSVWRGEAESLFAELVVESLADDPNWSSVSKEKRYALHLRPAEGFKNDEAADALRLDVESLRSELQNAKAAVACSGMAQSMLLADISEDLRTPLDVVIGYSEMLQDDARDQGIDQFAQDAHKIEKAGKRLLVLANDMMNLALMQTGKVDLYLHTFELSMLTREITKAAQPQLDANGNQLEIEYRHRPGHGPRPIADAGTIHADRTKLVQTLLNVLTCAIQESVGKSIMLSIQRDYDNLTSTEWVHFRIEAAHTGYESQQAQRLLDDVRDTDAIVASTGTGSALEMEISGRFCQMMGGELIIDRQPGRETEFTIKVPAIVKDPKAISTSRNSRVTV